MGASFITTHEDQHAPSTAIIRQNGGTKYKVQVFIDRCDIAGMDEAIFRTDSKLSTVSMTNTRYSDIGDALFIGVKSSNITTANNTEY